MFDLIVFFLCPGVGHNTEVDIDTIPEPVPRGAFKPVVMTSPPTYVVVDLETTDLSEYLFLIVNCICLFGFGTCTF